MRTNNQMAGVLSASALALGLIAMAQPALAGISNTKHNLSSSQVSAGNNRVGTGTNGTADICVFCHTPHGSNTDVKAPLWNKWGGGKNTTSYTSYNTTNSATFDATQYGPGNISLACLTCHDGTQAMDNIMNAPGSGQFSTNGGGTTGLTYVWSGTRVTAAGLLTGLANLGSDLSNDHPVGMNYCGATNGNSIATPASTCADKDFATGVGGAVGVRAYIELGTAGSGFQKTDLPLYGSGDNASTSRVECATCHDPHIEDTQPTSTLPTFLRATNAGSVLCLACHTK